MAYNEFENITTKQLKQMLVDCEIEADHLTSECMERHQQAFEAGETPWSSDPACDYVADDLHRRADAIRQEIKTRFFLAAKLNPTLLDEYGLNEVTFRLLDLAYVFNLFHWGHSQLKKISGQPANSLRKLIDRGLLAGPARGEKIASKPFELTPAGKDILQKIERGLHHPDWLSAGKLLILEYLEKNSDCPERELLDHGAHKMSLISLLQAEYITLLPASSPWYDLTPLGREALNEYRQE